MGNIIELPRAKELEDAVSVLRRAAAEAICANISLVYVEGRAIEMNYRLAFGPLEIDILDTYCCTLRLRRKREVIRGKFTRQEPRSMKILEAQLDEELARYEGELARKKRLVKEARRWEKNPRGNVKEGAMKAQLTAVILALHPDIRPEKRTSRTLNEAVDAYIDGDGKKLRRLRKDVADGTDDDLPLGGLIDEEKRLRDLIRALEAENGAVQIRAPFTMRGPEEKIESIAQKNELPMQLIFICGTRLGSGCFPQKARCSAPARRPSTDRKHGFGH